MNLARAHVARVARDMQAIDSLRAQQLRKARKAVGLKRDVPMEQMAGQPDSPFYSSTRTPRQPRR